MSNEYGEIITAKVFRVHPEQKEKLERQANEIVERAREKALTKIRERYEQRVKEIRNDDVRE